MVIRVSKNRITLESVPINEAKGSSIASASTCNIGAATGNYVHITGTTTITSFGTATQAGITRTLVFDDALTLTHNASAIVLPTGANITTAAGDTAVFVADTTSIWECVEYMRASGQPLAVVSLAQGGTGQTSASSAINALLPSQSGHSGEFLTTNGSSASWAEAGGVSSGSGQATKYDVTQSSHGLSVGDVIKSTGSNTYGKAQADSAANSEVVGIVTTVTDSNNFTFTAQGIITAGVPAQAAGTVMFLDPSTAGALTATEPSTSGQVSKPVLIVLENATKAVFQNFRGMEIVDPPNYDNTEVLIIPISDEITSIETGTAVVTFHMPYEFNLTAVKAGLTTSSSSGNPTFDVNDDGSSIFSTNLSIDSGETFSDTATTTAVLSSTPTIIASGSVMTIDIDTAGTGATGAKIYLIGTYNI